MQSSHAWAYWLRGTAIACQLNQELTDRVTFLRTVMCLRKQVTQ